MAWGANKFTKKILKPKAINNNELLDYISRVPDNEELVRIPLCKFALFRDDDEEGKPISKFKRDYRELPSPEDAKAKEKAKKKPANDNVII